MRCDGTATRAAGFHGASNSTLRRGVTLTEAVLFISVALGIIVGGLVYFPRPGAISPAAATLSAASRRIRWPRGNTCRRPITMTRTTTG